MSEQTEKKKLHKTRQILIIAAGILSAVILIYIFVKSITIVHDGKDHNQLLCGSHISSLGKELMIYANDHNDLYPDANKWCDILMKVEDFSEKVLKCPDDKVGPCSYAMNPNCKSPLASTDLVLLFESKPGWNQNGGPELLADNHKGGSNILFNDGHVLFVEVKDFNNLKWK